MGCSSLAAEKPIPSCPAAFADLLSNRVFNEYAAEVAPSDEKTVPPIVKTGRAHLYRTVIREGAKRGPNFAGHYTVIEIGCGAATVCLAISDARSGKVYFPSNLNDATALLVDTGNVDVATLNYRKNSRLLVVIGLPNENPKRAGASYYVWKSNKLQLIRFIPANKLCGLPSSTQF